MLLFNSCQRPFVFCRQRCRWVFVWWCWRLRLWRFMCAVGWLCSGNGGCFVCNGFFFPIFFVIPGHWLDSPCFSLSGLTSIDKDVAQELAKSKGRDLRLDGLTSIDKDVLLILKSNRKILLPKKYYYRDPFKDKKD